MGAAGAIVSLLGVGVQAYGIYSDSQAKAAQEKGNADLAAQAAADALDRGKQESGRTRIAGSQLVGKQRVAYAASGVDPTKGTAADVQGYTAGVAELDAKTAENNAAREAWGFRKYGTQYMQEAALERQRGSYQAAGTILSGLGRYGPELVPSGK